MTAPQRITEHLDLPENKRALLEELLERYEISAREHDDLELFRCRRCLSCVSWEHGSDDLAGLCSPCWIEVDTTFRGGKTSLSGKKIRSFRESIGLTRSEIERRRKSLGLDVHTRQQ